MSYEFWGSSDWILKESSIKSSCARAMRDTIFAVFCWAFSAPSGGVLPSWSPSIISVNRDVARSRNFFNKRTASSQLNFGQCHNNDPRINKDHDHALYYFNYHSSGVNLDKGNGGLWERDCGDGCLSVCVPHTLHHER